MPASSYEVDADKRVVATVNYVCRLLSMVVSFAEYWFFILVFIMGLSGFAIAFGGSPADAHRSMLERVTGVGVENVYEWCQSGKVPFIQNGVSVVYVPLTMIDRLDCGTRTLAIALINAASR